MVSLSVRDFPRFFEALHSRDSHSIAPFPWQHRLIRTVEKEGWPDILDLATGSGKTAVLDIAVFHLALEASRSNGAQKAPRRIVMIVDRRTVVDQAFKRAELIRKKLSEASDGILKEVASALRTLAPPRADGATSEPLLTAELRGGMYRDPAWARTPDQPLIVASTVDQVGSRLLFRGYGVSDSMRPVHAGLLSNDTLLFLDEVHLSRPFDETLEALKKYREWAEEPLSAPWRVVRLSATPGVLDGKVVFSLDDDDRRAPLLAKRLAAHKPARVRLVVARGEEEEKRQQFARECAKESLSLLQSGLRTVAVVVNRVDTARRIYESVCACRDELVSAPEVVLLTGRMRPFDRDELMKRLAPRIDAGRQRNETSQPLVVVSTQCIEAGADFDFDGLVTECASLDALRQRFGRLDRLGDFQRARGFILARKDMVESKDADPIYGLALRNTWDWLSGKEDWDFGIDYLKMPTGAALLNLLSARQQEEGDDRRTHSPVMLPAHLDAWVQTSLSDRADRRVSWSLVDPDVSLWLHGLSSAPADVQIIWRADIDHHDLNEAVLNDEAQEEMKNWLAVCPPTPTEAMPVPINAVRAWLTQMPVLDVSDVEGEAEEKHDTVGTAGRRVIRWRGDDTEVIQPSDIVPGDTIVVPTNYGGLGGHRNWDPRAKVSSSEIGMDIGELAQIQQRGRAILRLHPAVLQNLGLPGPPALNADDAPRQVREVLLEWLDHIQQPELSDRPLVSQAVLNVLTALRKRQNGRIAWRAVTVRAGAASPRTALVARRPITENDEVGSEPDISAFTGAAVTLEQHSRGVEEWARHFARTCGLPQPLIEDLALAGWLHDVGKADPRFQALLGGGSEVAVAMGEALIAKSTISHRDRASRDLAQKLSRYPRGTRHEMLSVALVQGVRDLERVANDWDLVVHLIASHHGYARPFAPPVEDMEPLEVSLRHGDLALTASTRHHLARLDSPVPERFWRLVRKYGWFGLAWLEAILRLADHRCSESESREEVSAWSKES